MKGPACTMHSPLRTVGWSILCLAVLTRAYRIDDTNGTIMYSPPNMWTQVHAVNNATVNNATFNVTQIFNATYSVASCRATLDCHAMIPFTGSGITVYSLIYDQVNASFVVDGGPSNPAVYDASCHVFNASVPSSCYNASVYDIQSLAYDSHMLVIALMDYNGNNSTFRFDYAVVNETYSPDAMTSSGMTSMDMTMTPSSATMMPSETTMSPMPSSSKSRKKTIAAAVGGTFGGLAAVGAIILVLLFLRKRNRRNPTPLDEYPWAARTAAMSDTSSTRFRPGLDIHESTTEAVPPSVPISSIRSEMHTPSHSTPVVPSALSPQYSSRETDTTVPTLHTLSPRPPRPPLPPIPVLPIPALANPAGSGQHAFTDMQISSIQNLLRNNVPGPLVANVMESMIAGGAPSILDGSNTVRSASPTETMELPRYQYKDGG